ncbi:hypothetical protein D7D26_05330 [Pyramidobacter sp. CG50-2]|nr:hypothetical protein D7D26_05330 [Pyramidobacter sp. CG50-2]
MAHKQRISVRGTVEIIRECLGSEQGIGEGTREIGVGNKPLCSWIRNSIKKEQKGTFSFMHVILCQKGRSAEKLAAM